MNFSAAHHRRYVLDHVRGAAVQVSRLAAYLYNLKVSFAAEVVEAGQARAGTVSKFGRPGVGDGESLATVVQKQDRMLLVVRRGVHRLLWLIGGMKMSLTRAKQAGLVFDCKAFAKSTKRLALL